jgi:hypothetical protein
VKLASLPLGAANVSVGSKSEVGARNREISFALSLKNRHRQPGLSGPKSANERGYSITSSARGEQRWRNGETERLGNLEVDYELVLDRQIAGLASLRICPRNQ